jgi:hypothetical protein
MDALNPVRAIIFDVGGVLVRDMSWNLIVEKAPEKNRQTLQKAITYQWSLMRVDPEYKEEQFWNGITTPRR